MTSSGKDFAHGAPSDSQFPPDYPELPKLPSLSSQDDCLSSQGPTLAKPDLRNAVSVCYTNHALNQFLENLLKDGITNIVRIGSDSKSDTGVPLSLQTVARRIDRTRLKNEHIDTAEANRVEAERGVGDACEQLLHLQGSDVLRSFFDARDPQAFDELFAGEDKAGFRRVRSRRREAGRRPDRRGLG
ncbi:hypothetical protein Q9L58_010296 [Maublancomyces gigas]|uniref:Uncharacterized protein n=1 Tax=Discina gigas TaxID=1032678 RepID=A0ABR3G4K1_9PEZI